MKKKVEKFADFCKKRLLTRPDNDTRDSQQSFFQQCRMSSTAMSVVRLSTEFASQTSRVKPENDRAGQEVSICLAGQYYFPCHSPEFLSQKTPSL